MPLTGQDKTDYQREYMRRRRSNTRSNIRSELVRPEQGVIVRPKTGLVRPACISNNQWAYMQHRAEEKKQTDRAEDADGQVSKP